MQPNVIDLKAFYESPLGHMVTRILRRRVRAVWPDVTNQRVLGFGYATPFLLPFNETAERSVAFMPSRQGVHRWPNAGRNSVALVDGPELPLPDAMMDRVLLVHGLEHEGHARIFLREIWRVMAPEGKLLIIVPNRRGLWARREKYPFGSGSPFSTRQLNILLWESLFAPLQSEAALYFPPSPRRLVLRTASLIEGIGARVRAHAVAGALLVEATKQVYAPTALREVRSAARRRVIYPIGTSTSIEAATSIDSVTSTGTSPRALKIPLTAAQQK